MAWVAAYAGWSSLIGLVVAAVTGDAAREVSPGASAGLTVLGPLVPTLVALWFNDWARDGFPTREQRRARAAAPAPAEPAPPAEPAEPDPTRSVKITTLERSVGTSQNEGETGPEAPGFPVAPLLRDGS
jgi:hypothetical protein